MLHILRDTEWLTRHKNENHVVLIGSNWPIKRVTLFPNFDPTVDLTANISKSPYLYLSGWERVIILRRVRVGS